MENVSFFIIYILLPIAGIVALVFVSILLYNIVIVVKKVHPIIDDVNHKLDVLNIPVDAIVKVNNSWHKMSNTISKFFMKK